MTVRTDHATRTCPPILPLRPRSAVPRGAGWRAVLAVLATTLAISCQRGPGPELLQQQLQAKLDNQFGPGVFEIDELVRRGSQPLQEEGDPQPRLLVYFNAEIRFGQDYTLSNWDQLNVGSLVSVLGATPLGVDGVKTEGNRAGDRLRVHGSSAYIRTAAGWEPMGYFAGHAPPRPSRPNAEEPAPYRQRLEEIGQIGKQFQRRGGRAELALLETDLDGVLAAAQRRLARSRGWITLATGNPAGEYHALGEELEDLLDRRHHRAAALATSGSAENCHLVHDGEVRFALAQNDVVYMAHSGTGLFERHVPLGRLRALATLYPEAVQVVTLASSDLAELSDLRGRRIDIGMEGSGQRINAVQLLKAAGVDLTEIAEVRGTSPSAAITALEEQRIDALFVTGAYPAAAILELASKRPIRLLAPDEDTVRRLQARYPFILPLRIPKNTYPDMASDVPTVGVTAMLIARDDAPDADVELLLSTLFDELPTIARTVLPAYFIAADRALRGIPIPVHPAARRFFERS